MIKKLLNFRPVLFTAFLVGMSIISAYLFCRGNILGGVLCVSLTFVPTLILCFIFGGTRLKRNLIFFGVALIISSLCFSTFMVRVKNFEKANFGGLTCSVTGRVKEVSNTTDYSLTVILEDVSIHGKVEGETGYKISVFISGESDIDVGDNLAFNCTLNDNGLFYENRFMAERVLDGVKYSTFINAEDVLVKDNDTTLFEKANLFIRDTLRKGLEEKPFIVAYALLCGNSDYVQSEVFTPYRKAGVAHIFAVSGLHIGFVAVVLSFVLKRLKINPYVKVFITVLGLLFYSGICGFSASSLRATVMYGILLLCSSMGERYDGLTSISLAFILILLINPIHLYCAGFILSFVVVLGITLLSKPIQKLFKFLPQKLASGVAVVISAQLFSIPASILLFGNFSLIAVIINLLFVPIVGAIFILLFVCTILGGIFSIEAITLFIPNYVLIAVNYLINLFDYSIFMIGGITIGAFAIFYYLALITASGIVNVRGKVKAISSMIFALIFIVGATVLTVKENRASKIYVIGSRGVCTTVIDMPEENLMIVNNFTKNFSVSRLKSLSTYNGIEQIDRLYITKNQNGIDVNSLLTKLNGVFSVKEVYFAKERDSVELSVLEKSFEGTLFFACGENGKYIPENSPIKFSENGYMAMGNIDEFSFALFGSMGRKTVSLRSSDKNYSLIVAFDYLERINGVYKNQRFISYRPYSIFEDAEQNGTVAIKI